MTFSTMASHELSAPLTAVKLQTQLAQRRLQKRGELQLADDLTKLQEPIGQLERLVRELFDVSKMQASRLEYLREPVEMNVLLYKVADMMHQQNPTYTILVQNTQPLTLMGDTKRLEQVFINLLSNAIKYSPKKKRVELTMSASDKTVTISVRDYGLGISQEYQKHIFERFYRIDHQKQGSIGGLGIGLYIVAEVVKRHGGTITVESCRGEGSTFQVILPLEIP